LPHCNENHEMSGREGMKNADNKQPAQYAQQPHRRVVENYNTGHPAAQTKSESCSVKRMGEWP